MKTRLYALALAAMALIAQVMSAGAVSEAPGDTVIRFPDPAFEEGVRDAIGKPAGDITIGDVAGIEELYVSGLGIADLTGIEYFTALKLLACRQNMLTALDVGRNAGLEELYCCMNRLTTLNVSRNSALIGLECEENFLTALDVSGNPALVWLWCDYNLLTALDVSGNPALRGLSFDYNQLTALDVSRNIALERLDCHNNFIPDTSAITGLDKTNLLDFRFCPQANQP